MATGRARAGERVYWVPDVEEVMQVQGEVEGRAESTGHGGVLSRPEASWCASWRATRCLWACLGAPVLASVIVLLVNGVYGRGQRVIPNQLGIHRVLQSLPPSYKNFVYNMQNMNKELTELFSMLKAAEIEIHKEHQVLMVNKTTKQGKPKKGNVKKGGKLPGLPRSLRYQSDPGMEHWTVVKNILKYLKRTKDMFLCYGGDQELVVASYTDASWNTDPDDSKSQGYVFILNGAAVSCVQLQAVHGGEVFNRIGIHSGFGGFKRYG
ncbi:hypothetical protein QYE76_003172 [Lolium multiflorum]|uniref:Uncharacterized protein n=1 Tax=Lolium multiflorum TaxID=4521 RepID=A0AAD8RR04_LOLMU|nr:hypothetical protein QYE76_003172 [Lolium multiflorum]